MGERQAARSSSSLASARVQRLVIVGVEGSGKTTLARHLAERLSLPHVELDALYWDANWTRVSPHLFRERVAQTLDAERWVTDGNYDAVRDLVWGRADTVVWLDYPLRVIVPRLVWRSVFNPLPLPRASTIDDHIRDTELLPDTPCERQHLFSIGSIALLRDRIASNALGHAVELCLTPRDEYHAIASSGDVTSRVCAYSTGCSGDYCEAHRVARRLQLSAFSIKKG